MYVVGCIVTGYDGMQENKKKKKIKSGATKWKKPEK